MKTRSPLIALMTLAGVFAAGAAQARGHDDVRWSVTIGSPGAVPVYVPAPAVVVRPAYVPVQRVYYREPTRWDVDGDGVPNRYDRVYNPRWDVDGDGIPNRHEYRESRRWDADRDGIPNRVDRVYNPHWDRDGDGIPNRADPRPERPDRFRAPYGR
jgi:hypothetical protein